MTSSSPHVWKFFRCGGLDQVALESVEDLLALDQLDQKLWVALGCPVKGTEIDEKTLALIDTDGDGRIVVPEVLAAIKWAVARLNDATGLLRDSSALPLAVIDSANAEGRTILHSAQQILTHAGKGSATAITVDDAANAFGILAEKPLIGDGIVLAGAAPDAGIQSILKDIIATTGGTTRKSGAIGVTSAQVESFFADLSAYAQWAERGVAPEVAFMGESTGAAYAAIQALRSKVDDYFMRARLAAFDPRAVAALNRPEAEYTALSAKLLTPTSDEIGALPLARVEPGAVLPLGEGVNPAWADAVTALCRAVVRPLVGADKTDLSRADWATLNHKFEPYRQWLADEPALAVKKLGLPRIKAILGAHARPAIEALLAQDKALEAAYQAIGDVERLTRYYRDLRTLLHNFVNFADFYSRDRYAAFQAGTLYLDGRSTELCVRVDATSTLAAMSKAYIAYCTCTPAGGGAPMLIAACFTQGDSDYLFAGRNGLFYDRRGRPWHAVINAIVDNPISIGQAFWAPYKKLLRFIEEQVAKRAAAADTAATSQLTTAAEKTVNLDKREAVRKVDVGTVAALGVAITGAISALTLILGYVFGLRAWQYPFAALGIILVISGPSMVIAWLKLRQRTLGPILDANGWAINGRVKINIPFGAALTQMATLPTGAKRSLEDPYEDKEASRRQRRLIVLLILVVLAAAAIWVRWDRLQRGRYFWQPAPAPVAESKPS